MDRKIVYEGRRIKVGTLHLTQKNGEPVTKDVVVHPGAVAVLPMLEGDRICLIRNQRHSVGEELVEIVAGTLEPPEAPEVCALREVAEETGYRAAQVTKLAEFFTSPGVLTEKMHLFVAEGLEEGEQHLDAGEEIQRFVVPWSEAVRMATDGTIRDAKSIAGILLYDRLK